VGHAADLRVPQDEWREQRAAGDDDAVDDRRAVPVIADRQDVGDGLTLRIGPAVDASACGGQRQRAVAEANWSPHEEGAGRSHRHRGGSQPASLSLDQLKHRTRPRLAIR